ncbi:hypothetical protein HYY72_01995 [Candidatus Woesearchaeota archaeon]|nr:hypothetical protein [Candidatus Woesearchaeota archaeon]
MEFRAYITEGMRIFYKSLHRRLRGHRKYSGNATEICRQVVDECWNGRFFQTSTGHFCQFYSRDFGICADSLVRLGYRDNVIRTLGYALDRFSSHNGIKVAITPGGMPFDFPYYGIDSVAFILRALRAAGARELVEKHRDLLEREILRLHSGYIEKDTGLVRRDVTVSSMKDYSRRKSSCYDNSMAAMIRADAEKLRLENPFRDYSYGRLLRENFWNGSYFLDDLSSREYVAGDANIFPFWTGAVVSKGMLKSAVESIRQEGLDRPFPLKYTSGRVSRDMVWHEFLVKDWQKDSIWSQMGIIYIGLLKGVDKADFRRSMGIFKGVIEQNRNYMEVFTSSGKRFKTAFYHSDTGMLWASNYLALVENV